MAQTEVCRIHGEYISPETPDNPVPVPHRGGYHTDRCPRCWVGAAGTTIEREDRVRSWNDFALGLSPSLPTIE